MWVTGKIMEQAAEKAKAKLGVKSVELVQDEDVLDTWFSSGLFPFSVFGWPNIENNEDFDAFFPTSLLETGHDILFFWVARMVMMSIGLTGKLPFHTVYLHAMVRDAHGRKMSKSLGNVIDPIDVIEGITLKDLQARLHEGNLPEKEIVKAAQGQEKDFPEGIPQCGADALRFGLLAYTLQGRNVNLDINRVVGYRHFCNKVWNATILALRCFGADYKYRGSLPTGAPFAWEDRWILSRLSMCADKTDKAFKKYEFANATTATYSFFLHDFCDVYLELLKPRFDRDAEVTPEILADRNVACDVLYTVLDQCFRLMHPLLPFLTEELYQRLPPSPSKCESICIAPYPTHVIAWQNVALEEEMDMVREIVGAVRSLKESLGLLNKARPSGFIRHTDAFSREKLGSLTTRVSRMSLVGDFKVLPADAEAPPGTLSRVVNNKCLVYMEVAGVDLSKELEKLKKKIVSTEKTNASLLAKIEGPGSDKVPADIKEKNLEKLEAGRVELLELNKSLESIQQAMKG